MPVKFISGHQGFRRQRVENAAPFKIDGVYCRLIPLTNEMYAIVDAADYEWLMQWKWHAEPASSGNGFYAARAARDANGKQRQVSMHRQILGLQPGDPREGDHIRTGDTLDNRRANVRVATVASNAQNRLKSRRNSSGVKGISWSTRESVWIGKIMTRGKLTVVARSKSIGVVEEKLKIERAKQHGDFANHG